MSSPQKQSRAKQIRSPVQTDEKPRERPIIGDSSAARPCYYSDYLQLNTLLSAQQPASERRGKPAHDEVLFIIMHQSFELWFKQILHELDRIQNDFRSEPLEDVYLGRIVHSVDRINEILKLITQQFAVIETMTALDFLDFREFLRPASGFQSVQFRAIEIRLGLRRDDRQRYAGQEFDAYLNDCDRAQIAAAEVCPTLREQVDAWLARTPFVEMGTFIFNKAYLGVIERKVKEDLGRLVPYTANERERAGVTEILADLDRIQGIFKPTAFPPLTAGRMSLRALQAALFITVYQDQPVLQLPFRLLTALIDMDELFTLWRFRHSLMVQRMIGGRMGTGGSSGYDYLRTTAERHRVFAELFQLSTYLIPRSEVPKLPAKVKAQLQFVYASRDAAHFVTKRRTH